MNKKTFCINTKIRKQLTPCANKELCWFINAQLLIISEILESLGKKDNPNMPVGNPAELAKRLGNIAEVSMGGSSGGVSVCVVHVVKIYGNVLCQVSVKRMELEVFEVTVIQS